MNQAVARGRSRDDQKEVLAFFEHTVPSFIDKLQKIARELEKGAPKAGPLYENFKSATAEVLSRGEALAQGMGDRLAVKQVKQRFRDAVSPWFYEGTLIQRGYEKPQGYPGDFRMIETFYNNKVASRGLQEFCDRYMLEQDYVQAVRDRKERMKAVLTEYIGERRERPLRILNLGSGSCRELREMPEAVFKAAKGLEITLLDQDRASLDFSKEELSRIHPGVQFRFEQANVLDYARHPESYREKFGEKDLIYSIGLADYIHDACLGGMMATSMELLRPGGRLVVAHKNVRRHRSVPSDWFCDWNFIPRNEKEFTSLMREHLKDQKFTSRIEQVEEGHVFFVSVEKR
jgi:hypothetical protein